MKTLSLGYSPCPNDTFIFHALTHGKVRAEGVTVEERLLDVETLNGMALRGELDLTKVSFAAAAHLMEEYCILKSGGALGRGCGPLVVARDEMDIAALKNMRVAIPGNYTTAFLLLKLRGCGFAEAVPMQFDRIMPAVASGDVDAGLVIHEGRFTYQGHGLKMVADLGEWWEKTTGMPIPLGCILARRSLGADTIRAVEDAIRASILHARAHPRECVPYIKAHAQELDDSVIARHIGLYVNEFSLDLGEEGVAAVNELFAHARAAGAAPESAKPLFPQ